MTRVIIADDSLTARTFIQRCLEIAGLVGAEFVPVVDGREALASMQETRPDLLVTDLTMPDLGGVELLTRMAASPALRGVPTLVISSQANPQLERELAELGAGAVLRKPVSPAAVAAAVEPLLQEDP
jgi:two-component system chemotaxis response regulator CheY